MKKLFLILSIVSNAWGMNSENDSRSIISKQAAPLHEFLTENLDNQEAAPDDKTVDDLADQMNKLSLNTSVLLDLDDKRSQEEYNFKRYLSARQQKNQRCFILNERASGKSRLSFFSCHIDDSKPLPDQTYKHKISQEEQIASISIDDPVNGKQRERQVTKFVLLANGDKKYASDSNEYSLIDLLMACKRPGIVVRLLDRSRYITRFADTARLKACCTHETSIDDWKKLEDKLDDAATLAATTNLALSAKTTALHNLPTAAYLMREENVEVINRFAMIAADQSYEIEIDWNDVFNEKGWDSDDYGTGRLYYSGSNGKQWVDLTCYKPSRIIRGLACVNLLQRLIWHPLVDAVEDALDVDERSAALLSIKPIGQRVIDVSNACKAFPGQLKAYFGTSKETSQHSNE